MARSNRTATPSWTAVLSGTGRLDLVRVEHHGDKPVVLVCESYPPGDSLAGSLARLRQSGKLGGRCTTLLRPGEYQFLNVEAPNIPDSAPVAEMREALRWKIKDMVDFPVAAAGIDFLRVPTPAGRPPQVLAAAASHGVLTPRIQAFQEAKADLGAVDLPELAQRNIAALFETPDRGLALLVFNDTGGLLTFSCNGELYATRRIDVTAKDLAAGGVSVYERVVLEVQRSLDHFDRNFSQISLERLLVLPVPGADDFIQHLKDNLYQPVAPMRITDGLDISRTPVLDNPATLADALPAIGAALRDEDGTSSRQINLFDPALQKQRDPWTARTLVAAVGVVLVAVAAGAGWAHYDRSMAAQAQAASAQKLEAAKAEGVNLSTQLATRKPDERLAADLVITRARLAGRTEVLALLKKGLAPEAVNQADVLRGFARQVPNGLWLTGFDLNAETGALSMRGRTVDAALIPDYVRRLGEEKAFRGRTFAALEINAGKSAAATPGAGATAVVNPALMPASQVVSSSGVANALGVPYPAPATSIMSSPGAPKAAAPAYLEFELRSGQSDAPQAALGTAR